jgi:hypothetical protein
MSSPEAKNLEAISKAIDQHNASCPFPAVAVEMNSFEAERLGWDTIRGLPVRENPDLGSGRFRIVCAREEGEPGEVVEAVAEPAEPVPARGGPEGVTARGALCVTPPSAQYRR